MRNMKRISDLFFSFTLALLLVMKIYRFLAKILYKIRTRHCLDRIRELTTLSKRALFMNVGMRRDE